MDGCERCTTDYFECIARYYENNDGARALLRAHGVLPSAVKCLKCQRPCKYSNKQTWRCSNSYVIPKSKKRRYCGYSVSDNKGTFLESSHIPPWKIVLFLNHWLSEHYDCESVSQFLGMSQGSSVEWSSSCSEVTEFWLEKQDSIGGDGVIVEVDETLIVKRKYEGPTLSQVWVFGGIERESKKLFVVPLFGPVGEKRDVGTLLPLIKQYIQPGSVIISGQWASCHKLSEHGFTHYMTDSSEDAVDPEGCAVHTQNIEQLWRDLRELVKRRGIKSRSLYQCLAKYLFIKAHRDEYLHQFLVHTGKLYSPGDTNEDHGSEPPQPSEAPSEAVKMTTPGIKGSRNAACVLCRSTKRSHPHLSFHQFPREETSYTKWLMAIGLSDGTNTLTTELLKPVVCSDHFTPDSYIPYSTPPTLWPHAVPNQTISDHGSEPPEPSEAGKATTARTKVSRSPVCVLCRSNKRTHPQFLFHQFPREETRYAEWLKAIGHNDGTNTLKTDLVNPVVCSHHFTPDCYKPHSNPPTLLPHADPNQNISGHGSKPPKPSEGRMKVTHCVLCQSSKRTHPHLSFHQFPKEETRYAEWLKAIGHSDGTNTLKTDLVNSVVCCHHFTPDCYKPHSNPPTLLPHAVPNQNISGHGTKPPKPSEGRMKVTHCVLCQSSKRTHPHLSFHRFPRKKRSYVKWLKAIGRGKGTNTHTTDLVNSVVCSNHFTRDCFKVSCNRRKLFPHAVPNLNISRSRKKAPPKAKECIVIKVFPQGHSWVSEAPPRVMAEKERQKRLESSRTEDLLPVECIKTEVEPVDVKEEPPEEKEIPQEIMTPEIDITIKEEDILPAIKTEEEDILPEIITVDPSALTS